jgi:hypothetical protein
MPMPRNSSVDTHMSSVIISCAMQLSVDNAKLLLLLLLVLACYHYDVVILPTFC